jgi:hypothetical protein
MIPKSKPKNNDKFLRPQRGLGQAVSRQRRKTNDALRRERESRINRDRQLAREILNAKNLRSPEEQEAMVFAKNLLSATVSNQRAVMHSYGIDLPIECGTYWAYSRGGEIKAWTDFRSINISLPDSLLPQHGVSHDEIIDFVATVRGIFQHELGHVRFTVPFANLPWDDEDIKDSRRTMHWAWNCLEDQRMEAAVVKAVPLISSYFTKMIGVHILSKKESLATAWLLVAGRRYLSTAVRQQAYDIFASNHGHEAAVEWRQIVSDYTSATTDKALSEQVIRAHEFLVKHNLLNNDLADTSHERQTGGEGWSNASSEDGATDEDDEDDESDTGTNGGATDTDEGEDADEEGQSSGSADGESDDDEGDANGSADADSDANGESGDKTDTPGDADTASGNSSGGDGATKQVDELEDMIREAVESATKAVRQDKANHSVVVDANELQNRTGSLPWIVHTGSPMPAPQQEVAEQLAIGMEQALSDFVTASQPVWQSHQERGVIDPIAFRTKSVGDNAYRRGMDGDANAGLDLHVSLLCDASVSMQGDPMVALSQAMYATATACDRLGIGTSFTLWSSPREDYRVDAGQPVIWPTLGGTDPTAAMDDLDSHNPEEASNHLVIIFTDGDWETSFPGLHQWERPGRHIVLVQYHQHSWMSTAGPTEDRRGADEAVIVHDILRMPMEMTAVIANILSK